MSINQKDLDKVVKALKKGDYTKVAKKINKSQPWVSKVLGDLDLTNQNLTVLGAALDVIEEKNSENQKIKQRIQEVTG